MPAAPTCTVEYTTYTTQAQVTIPIPITTAQAHTTPHAPMYAHMPTQIEQQTSANTEFQHNKVKPYSPT